MCESHRQCAGVMYAMGVDFHPKLSRFFHREVSHLRLWITDQEVFRITSEISLQIFPMELDIHHKRWRPNLDRMNAAFIAMDKAKRRGGIGGKLSGWAADLSAARAFVALYNFPVIKHDLPASVRLEPAY